MSDLQLGYVKAYREPAWNTARFDIGNQKNLDWPSAWHLLMSQGHYASFILTAALREHDNG